MTLNTHCDGSTNLHVLDSHDSLTIATEPQISRTVVRTKALSRIWNLVINGDSECARCTISGVELQTLQLSDSFTVSCRFSFATNIPEAVVLSSLGRSSISLSISLLLYIAPSGNLACSSICLQVSNSSLAPLGEVPSMCNLNRLVSLCECSNSSLQSCLGICETLCCSVSGIQSSLGSSNSSSQVANTLLSYGVNSISLCNSGLESSLSSQEASRKSFYVSKLEVVEADPVTRAAVEDCTNLQFALLVGTDNLECLTIIANSLGLAFVSNEEETCTSSIVVALFSVLHLSSQLILTSGKSSNSLQE